MSSAVSVCNLALPRAPSETETRAIVALVTASALFFALLAFGENAAGIAAFLSLLIIWPVFFLGMSLLYFDQEARHAAQAAPRPPPASGSAARTPAGPDRP